MTLTFVLELRSEYHIGTGHGIGSQLDSALQRDGDGVPVLRGTTIAGLFRDGLWRLLQTSPCEKWFVPHKDAEKKWEQKGLHKANAYCENHALEKRCKLCQIFGTPKSPKAWRFSSARPIGAESLLAKESHWQNGWTASQRVMRNRVDLKTRRATNGNLFLQEEGDQRLRFRFTVSCPQENPFRDEHAAFLAAAARMIRRFGSARRRGRGACSISLVDATGAEDKTHLDNFRALLNGQELSRATESGAGDNEAVQSYPKPEVKINDKPKRIRVILRTDEPVLLAEHAEAGNMFDTRTSISGTTLLGALAMPCAASLGVLKRADSFDPTSAAYTNIFLELFLRGLIRFGALHPAYCDHTSLFPCMPAPLDLLTCKAYPGHQFNMADTEHHGWYSGIEEGDLSRECKICKVDNLKVEKDYPVIRKISSKNWTQTYQPILRDELHPRISPFSQRVVTGDLYGYTALDVGQFFIGEICCANAQVWFMLKQYANLPENGQAISLRLGKATGRGYGLVSIAFKEIPDSDGESEHDDKKDKTIDPFLPVPLAKRVTSPTERITMTLLTDAILPDQWGRFYQTLDETVLEQIFPEFKVKGIRIFCKGNAVDNFSNVTGLPRWRDLVIRAGSAVGFELSTPLKLDELHKILGDIEEQGIGLRRHEGFGRVVFNHPIYAGCTNVEDNHIDIPSELLLNSLPPDSQHTLKKEEKALDEWRRHMRRSDLFMERLLEKDSAQTTNEWQALSRWLYANADLPIDNLQRQLLDFGDPALLTSVAREKKGFVRELDEINKIKEHLTEAIAECEKREDSKEILADVNKAYQFVEKYSNWKEIENRCESVHEKLAEIEGLKKVRAAINEVLKQLRHLNLKAEVLFNLNDLLQEAALDELPLRAQKIRLFADRIAAVTQKSENPS